MESTEKTASPFPISLRWGLIMGALSAALGLLMFVLGFDPVDPSGGFAKTLGYLVTILVVGFCVWKAVEYHRDKELGGFLSIGRALGVGTLTGIVAGVIGAVWQSINATFIDTEFLNKIKAAAEADFEKQGLNEDQIELYMEKTAFMFGHVGIGIMTVIFTIFMCFIAGLVVGLILKKERPYLR